MERKRTWDFFSGISNSLPKKTNLDIKAFLKQAVENKFIPGAVIIAAKHGEVDFCDVIGYRQVTPDFEEMTYDTIFDIASLTKIVATWPAILILLKNGDIKLRTPISKYLDLAVNTPIEQITIFDLLTHTSGLPERTYVRQYGLSKSEVIKGICNADLEYQTGSQVRYSNRGFILLGAIIEAISKQRLDQFVSKEVWGPLGMHDTFFNPPPELIHRIAPTEYRSELKACQRGSVHDENANWLGGIAGHAGVFSTASDLSKLCAVIMADGVYHGQEVFNKSLIHESLKNQTFEKNDMRGLAWEFQKDATGLPIPCHTGFTGTSIWINPRLDAFVVLLTNRVHPERNNVDQIRYIRNYIKDICWGSFAKKKASTSA